MIMVYLLTVSVNYDVTSECEIKFTAVEDAAAESLSKHEGSLNLSRLTSLSDAAVESLSKHEGPI